MAPKTPGKAPSPSPSSTLSAPCLPFAGSYAPPWLAFSAVVTHVCVCLCLVCVCVCVLPDLPSCLGTGRTVVHVKGILRCALVTETSETFQTAEIDQLGLLANLQALISLSTDISEFFRLETVAVVAGVTVRLLTRFCCRPFVLLAFFGSTAVPFSSVLIHAK